MRIETIQVGKPKDIALDWTTAIYKSPVHGQVFLSKYNLEGDKQADLTVHGGLDKAVNVYPIEHYKYWNQRARFPFRKRINLPSPHNGAFGENFTVSGLTEVGVCIGDIYQIGSCIVEVSQPRQPCWKLARKFNQAKLPFWIQQTGKTGWYLRVLQEGHVQNSDVLELAERNNPSWSIAQANILMHSPGQSKDSISSLLECKQLSTSWRNALKKRLDDLA
ncbi:MAG: MOSC domain-containing protein [Gammaproteobacteria bacterium]|nr:MOSC domain-containing protein [Gammaproteobacteria bacterium]